MLDTEGQWSEALASNNVRAIIRWMRERTAEAEADMEEILPTFSCWVQRTSEFAKKELLTLCFSRCQGLWMFLDRSSFTRVHMLLQRLRNLLTLVQWARRQLWSAHLWHGVGLPCLVCRDTFGSSDVRCGCWNREHRTLKQHIWLGRLVQWWGIMGLLPKYPDAHEVKRISQMWKEMDHSHQKARLETPAWEKGEMERFRSLIQGVVTQLDRQHGCIWTSEDYTDQCYPPPNLQALLKLVLVPHIDNMSVQALLMYFVLDMANFLQCKDDLLQSFCHAFTIPPSFSQQIRAFWMLDHGHIKVQRVNTVSPEELVRLVREAVMEVRKPQPKISEVVWPEHTERKSNHREMSLSTQALCHLTPSPSPMNMVEETEQTAQTDEPEEEQRVHNQQPESPEHISSSEDLSSESVSSLPLLRPDCPYMYMQKISSLLTDGEHQSREEEEESRTPSSVEALPDCPELTMTPDGATDPVFLSSSAEENMACCKGEEVVHGPPDVTDLWRFALSVSHEDQPDCIPSQIFSFCEAATSDCFLEEECQETHAVDFFSQGLSCALPEATMLADLHQSLLSEHPVASGSGVSAGTGQQDISLLNPMCSSIFHTQLPVCGSSLTPSLTCNIITTSAPSDTTNESSPKSQLMTQENFVRSSSAWLDHCETGSWWAQDLETRRASTGLLPATEPGAAVTSEDSKRAPLVPGQLYSHSLVDFMDLTAKQQGDSRDDKQADKEEPAGWGSLGKGSQGAIRSGRTLLRKGKRVKRA